MHIMHCYKSEVAFCENLDFREFSENPKKSERKDKMENTENSRPKSISDSIRQERMIKEPVPLFTTVCVALYICSLKEHFYG